MEFFTGFVWPVPRAFASAVAACRFEQGDVLYDDAIAYRAEAGSWGEAAAKLGFSLQVLDPPRSTRNTPSEAGGRRFDANWVAPVTFERRDYRTDRTTTEQSTQGRVFTCLWRGDPKVLTPSDDDAPLSPPATARDLHAALEDALPGIRRACPSAASGDRLLYVFVVDEASETSLAKMRAVASILEARLETPPALLAPEEVLKPAQAFHPALRICACGIARADEQIARDLLQSVLYAPTRDASSSPEPDEERGSSRFRLERHGLFETANASR